MCVTVLLVAALCIRRTFDRSLARYRLQHRRMEQAWDEAENQVIRTQAKQQYERALKAMPPPVKGYVADATVRIALQ